MKTFLLILLVAAGVDQCSQSSDPAVVPVGDAIVIRSGTSFGMCLGYCVNELEVVGTKATFKKASRQDPVKYPAKSCQKTLTETKSADLKALAQFSSFRQVQEVIGCPDCADGGAEYIELQQGDVVHRVTFEYGKTIPGFDALVKDLRAQREQFKTCE